MSRNDPPGAGQEEPGLSGRDLLDDRLLIGEQIEVASGEELAGFRLIPQEGDLESHQTGNVSIRTKVGEAFVFWFS